MKKKPDPLASRKLAQQGAQKTEVLTEEEAFWAEDPKRAQAVTLLLQGNNKSPVARQLGVHRNTIDNWCKNVYFATEMAKLHREHVSSKRQQRLKSTNLVNDLNERVTIALGRRIEKALAIKEDGLPTAMFDDKDLRRYREMASEFRETREHERIDIGDDVKNININSQTRHTITGDVHVTQHGVNETAFTDYVRKALDTKVIDVKSIDVSASEGEGQLLLKAAEHLLVDTDLLDQINAEDMAAEEASKK